MLQTTPLREEVWSVLDGYKAELPAEQDQDEEDKIWRLVLHRVDTCNFAVSGKTEDGRAIVQTNEPPADVQVVVASHQRRSEAHRRRMGLPNWGIAVFRCDSNSPADPSLWLEKLAEAQACAPAETELEDPLDIKMAASGPDYVASVCVRDHWEQLSEDQRTWCANRICAAVIADADTRDDLLIRSRNLLDGSRPAAFVLSALFGKEIPSIPYELLIEALSIALTHPIEEIVHWAAQGVGTFLWELDRGLALTCIGALAQQAQEFGSFLQEQQRTQRRFDPIAEESFRLQLKQETRSRIKNRASFSEQVLLGLNLRQWPAQVTLPLLLAMLTPRAEEPLARSFLSLLVQEIALTWMRAKERSSNRWGRRNGEELFNPDQISGLTESVASFILRLTLEPALAFVEPILASTPDHPGEVGRFIDWLITVEDTHPSGEVFWAIWQAAANHFLGSDLPASLDDDYSEGVYLLRTLFFDANWKDTARDWTPLHGNEKRIQNLFDAIPPSNWALSAYTCFLYKIGAKTLPLPLIAIAAKLQRQDGHLFLSKTSIFYLENILSRLIQGGQRHLLARDDVRKAVLFLLDELVEQGSSTAYKLRDDFVTPGE